MSSSLFLGLRSLLWVVLLPGMMAGYLPWRFFGLNRVTLDWTDPSHWLGLAVMLTGATLLAACIWEFAHRGRGTLSPLDPPTELVVQGLYRSVRNPMYLAVGTTLLGELALIRTTDFLVYILAGATAVNVFVLAYEEPSLRTRFGESYRRYTARVSRWIPSIRHPYDGR